MSHDTDGPADGIAIVGLTGRFPGAPSIEAFWDNLRNGVESITVFGPEQLAAAGIPRSIARAEGYVPAAGVLDGIELFDAKCFGFSPRDAELLDPQQRLFLECAWEVLERAGCNPDDFPGLISVYAGTSLSTYAQHNLYPSVGIPGGLDDFQVFLSNDKDHVATRVAYKLNLRGAAVTVQTACSTSLVAVCVACDSLQAMQCDLAIAGGVTLRVPQEQGYFYREGGIGSPDGHCRSFDAAAKGTVGSSGVAVVALKRLSDALQAGDHVHAVIRGWALNNDGASKVGYTAPSVAGQAEVVTAALAHARIGPESISYIETHGTATPIGDPIEIAALSRVFARKPLPRRSCAIGSVKSNLGHLDSAAGGAALIKTALALEHRLIPASLHFTAPNPEIDFDAGPFFVNDRAREWITDQLPRRAGVSSFGIGGTNAHVVLEEAPAGADSDPPGPCSLFVLSAHTAAALDARTNQLADHLAAGPDINIADVASTLQIGRKALPHRRAFVARDLSDAVDCLRRRDPARVHDRVVDGSSRSVAFLFPGQGAQHAGMGLDLYRTCAGFAEDVDRGAAALQPDLGFDLRDAVFHATGPEAERRLASTAVAQPALFVIEYATARMWMRWGIQPDALLGHSLGEYVAACLAGVFTFEDALRLVAVRGALMGAMPGGAMTAVSLGVADLEAILDDAVGIAAVNAPHLTVVSGPIESIERLERRFADQGIPARRLQTSHAFHSSMMEPVLQAFEAEVRHARPKPPRRPVVSNVTGSWLTSDQATDPRYWARHARDPVRFADGLRTLRGHAARTLLEVGPGRTLGALARMMPVLEETESVLASLPYAGTPIAEHLAATIGELWLDGARIDWRALHGPSRRLRATLPTYPFERRRYWIEPPATSRVRRSAGIERAELDDWFSIPSWERRSAPVHVDLASATSDRWLVFGDRLGVAAAAVARLRNAGATVDLIADGDGPALLDAADSQVLQREYYTNWLERLDPGADAPPRVLHCWSLTGMDPSPSPARSLLGGLYSLMPLAQALLERYPGRSLRIDVVTDALHRVWGDEPLVPLKRALLAATRGVPQEYPQVVCRTIELDSNVPGWDLDGSVDLLLAEALGSAAQPHIAIRRRHRWAPVFERVALPASSQDLRLRHGGIYLITGGLGQIGLTLARHLASEYQAHLVLVGRTVLPDRREWERLLAAANGDTAASRVRAVRAIEDAGGKVLIVQGDAANPDDLRRAFDAARSTYGRPHGVIHGAGLTTPDGFAAAADVDVALCERQLAAKAGGALALAELLRSEPLDFVLLLSSLSSVLVGLGYIPYAAANMVLDAIAEQETSRGSTPWISVNWDGWDFSDGSATATDIVIRPAEGCAAFERILAAPHPQVVVSTADIDARIREWIEQAAQSRPTDAETRDPGDRHARPDLSSAFVEPSTDTERALAEIWQSLLGLQRVGARDNFFELGGHSLLAIQLTSRMRELFKVDVPVRTLFDAPTVSALAAFVDGGHARADADAARIVRVLDQVERLSDEEMRALVVAQSRSAQETP